jgi:hypothetical protein
MKRAVIFTFEKAFSFRANPRFQSGSSATNWKAGNPLPFLGRLLAGGVVQKLRFFFIAVKIPGTAKFPIKLISIWPGTK